MPYETTIILTLLIGINFQKIIFGCFSWIKLFKQQSERIVAEK